MPAWLRRSFVRLSKRIQTKTALISRLDPSQSRPRTNLPARSGLRCANPVHYPYSIVVDGLEEIAVDKSSATIFEHTNIFFPYQRLKTYPPKISTSLPTDFVRNFCHLFQHS